MRAARATRKKRQRAATFSESSPHISPRATPARAASAGAVGRRPLRPAHNTFGIFTPAGAVLTCHTFSLFRQYERSFSAAMPSMPPHCLPREPRRSPAPTRVLRQDARPLIQFPRLSRHEATISTPLFWASRRGKVSAFCCGISPICRKAPA